ncbi:MAG: hypothetical protein HZY75_11950 [Nocardioidaceae bacterium]|nr:MAG: hypothetical protein HZY75_11950 [Nocardioidaceae bacterium]
MRQPSSGSCPDSITPCYGDCCRDARIASGTFAAKQKALEWLYRQGWTFRGFSAATDDPEEYDDVWLKGYILAEVEPG